MLEELIEKISHYGKKCIGGFLGLVFGYILISYGFIPMLVVMLTTMLGTFISDKNNIKRFKKKLLDRLKEE